MEVIKIYKKQNNENVELRDVAQENRQSNAMHSSQNLDLGNSTLDLTMGLGESEVNSNRNSQLLVGLQRKTVTTELITSRESGVVDAYQPSSSDAVY